MALQFIILVTCLIGLFESITALPTALQKNKYSKVVLAENSVAAKNWALPEDSYLKVHIFNYTNLDRYLSGLDKKIKVKDLGPFTYLLHTTKTNVVFNSNNTITFKEHRSLKFVPEKSVGNVFENVIVPNPTMLAALEKLDESPLVEKITASFMFNSLGVDAFMNVSINDFMWGYTDKMLDLARLSNPEMPLKMGMLMEFFNDTSVHTWQIHTGVDDASKLGVVSQYKGTDNLDFSQYSECNKIQGSAGVHFPPDLLEAKLPLHLFSGIHKLPLHFEKEVMISDEIKVLRYSPPKNIFAYSDDNPELLCQCDSSVDKRCHLSGIFGNKKQEALYQSLPHFLFGDPMLLSEIDGMEPNIEKHGTYLDIDPRLSFAVDGALKMQLNAVFTKGLIFADRLKKMPDGLMLPIMWAEETVPEMSEERKLLISEMIYGSYI